MKLIESRNTKFIAMITIFLLISGLMGFVFANHLTAPSKPEATVLGTDTIRVEWGSNGNPTDTVYKLRYANNADMVGSTCCEYISNDNKFIYGDLKPNRAYYFQVAASDNRNGWSIGSHDRASGSSDRAVTISNPPIDLTLTSIGSGTEDEVAYFLNYIDNNIIGLPVYEEQNTAIDFTEEIYGLSEGAITQTSASEPIVDAEDIVEKGELCGIDLDTDTSSTVLDVDTCNPSKGLVCDMRYRVKGVCVDESDVQNPSYWVDYADCVASNCFGGPAKMTVGVPYSCISTQASDEVYSVEVNGQCEVTWIMSGGIDRDGFEYSTSTKSDYCSDLDDSKLTDCDKTGGDLAKCSFDATSGKYYAVVDQRSGVTSPYTMTVITEGEECLIK